MELFLGSGQLSVPRGSHAFPLGFAKYLIVRHGHAKGLVLSDLLQCLPGAPLLLTPCTTWQLPLMTHQAHQAHPSQGLG